MIWGWWVDEISSHLQQFFDALVVGERPKLAIASPPQHGKSSAATDFIAWVAGRDPDLMSLFASYSDDLGRRMNRDLRRIMNSPTYRRIFPETQIGLQGWEDSLNLIEYGGKKGSFRNTTVEGKINGVQLNLGVVDDPIKGREEASRQTTRNVVWDWFTDDFLSRFHADAGMIMIMTRWHLDDPLGRFIARCEGDNLKVLSYPAIAEADEPNRRKSEPLFPQWKPLDFLLLRKKLLSEASWQSLYQQNPIIAGGGVLPIDKMQVVPFFDPKQIVHTVRYWDKAGSLTEDAAYTAGVRMHLTKDKRYIISHIARGQWSALDREEEIKRCAKQDAELFGNYEVVVEQEPGSGGKESAENTIRNLAGFRVLADRVSGSKEVRAEPFVAQVQGGNILLVAGTWVQDFLDEAEAWPHGKRKDQIDAASGAFNRLVKGMSYNLNYEEWAF